MPVETVETPTPLAVTLQVIEEVRQRRARPIATYRLQLHAGFTLRDATAIIPYLHKLGISHVYCSPYLRARVGSTHGYDLCDHNQINPELGGEEAFVEFITALAAHGMGHILDMVPNHMAASTQNPWWYDVLENGPNSPYAHFFDIDWHPVKSELANKILLPILGSQYGDVLEQGQLKINFQDGAFLLSYFDNHLPLSPKSILPLLEHKLGELRTELGAEHAEVTELESIITGLEHLPSQTARDLASVRERQREKEVIKRRLRDLAANSQAVQKHIKRAIHDYNDAQADPLAVERLSHILDEQAYRLCHWRAAFDEINYRRFFDINELAALSMEAPEVFWRSHTLVRKLLADGSLNGLRIDHIDGLFGPERYLLRLQWSYLADLGQRAFERLSSAAPNNTGGASVAGTSDAAAVWLKSAPEVLRLCCEQVGLPPPGPDDLRALFGPDTAVDVISEAPTVHPPSRPVRGELPLYVLTEKILGPDEPLPETWPVAGTTGYDFVTTLNGLFVEPQGWEELVKGYQRFLDDDRSYESVVQDNKRLILRVSMSSELLMLAHRFNQISEQHRRTRDLTLNMLRYAVREVLVSFPVYRVYPSKEGVSERDRRFVDYAVARAKRQNPAFDPVVFDFVRNVLLLNHPPGTTPEVMAQRELLAGKFQQVTSPVMAKGVEDTSFYVWVPLASVNEVGGDPRRPTTSTRQFNEQNVERTSRYRQSMLATTTHDTKRSEDVRARLDVLSEIPRDWRSAVQKFSRTNNRWRHAVEGEAAPTLADEYLYYQSLVGIWPTEPPSAEQREQIIQRLQGYMEKATHEAKQRTSWVNPSKAYDDAVRDFVAKTLRDSSQNRFITDVQSLVERIAAAGRMNGLAQVALKLLSPGVADIYQGQELWDDSLVDPDNRRPVDYAARREALADVASWEGLPSEERASRASELGRNLRDPRLKLLVTRSILSLRARRAEQWTSGEYVPLEATGPLADHVVAFGWRGAVSQQLEVIAVIPRFVQRLIEDARAQQSSSLLPAGVWEGTAVTIPSSLTGPASNIFTGQALAADGTTLPISSLLSDFPIAVLDVEGIAS
jgi:(1->4)-alpha-D-glucan 1-alpha-D-glucosylmutase